VPWHGSKEDNTDVWEQALQASDDFAVHTEVRADIDEDISIMQQVAQIEEHWQVIGQERRRPRLSSSKSRRGPQVMAVFAFYDSSRPIFNRCA
jgi:hypothetical protein